VSHKAQSPANVRIQVLDAYKPAADGQSTHRKHDVGVRADIRSQQEPGEETGGPVRLVVEYSNTKDFDESGRVVSDWGPTRKNVTVRLRNLTENSQYFLHVHCEERGKHQISEPRNTNFYTERRPYPPNLHTPADNVTIAEGSTFTFEWAHQDADTEPVDKQAKAELRYRKAATLTEAPGNWRVIEIAGDTHEYDLDTNGMGANLHYDWGVRTKDVHSTFWSLWSIRSFYLAGTTTPPRPISPIGDTATSTDDGVTFEWRFQDPDPNEEQANANLRFRVADVFADPEAGWVTKYGTLAEPGGVESWTLNPGEVPPGYRYEWQVQTVQASASELSGWSRSGYFYAIRRPGWAVDNVGAVPVSFPQGSLGSGTYRVFAYEQGGQRYVGEIKPLATLQWGRVRDDISGCTLRTSGFGPDCGKLLGDLRTWAHEIVVWRGEDRVWEGPITRLAYHRDTVEIEARDPLAYVYRRIMRQGYNDNFRRPRQGIVGAKTVVERASLIIQNALAPFDPNVLPYLTVIGFPDDARQSRAVADWSKTAWEEVDDLAATAGLDYTCVGRRIILHDTHRPVGLIGEMREGDFFESPVITEYGMSAANIFGVTSNTGVYGKFEFPRDFTQDGITYTDWGGRGPLEMLASAYGEGVDTPADPRVLTREQRQELEDILNIQAARNINGRWATIDIDKQGTSTPDDDEIIVGKVYGAPLVVRVPDGSRVHPNAYVGIQQLVPGVHIPLRAKTMVREFAQVQKLDSINVTVEKGDEKIQVTMSPAPLAGLDSDQAVEEVTA
jgi:hypothetical protein